MSELVGCGARTHLWKMLNSTLDEAIALPDEQAAPILQGRLSAWDQVDILHERSYAERGQIALEFERRRLWEHVLNPVSGEPFSSFSAWATHGPLGGRRVTFESLGDVKALADVPVEQLREVPKSNIKILKKLSTGVRSQPEVLEAAKNLPADDFLAKIEREQPDQHLEGKTTMRFRPDRSKAEEIEEALKMAMDEGALGRDEALWLIAVAYKISRILEPNDAL